jgi:DNA invertase Pin-like site-specific DNA recombinase
MPFLELSESFTGIKDVAANGVSIIVLDEQGAHVSTDNGKMFNLLP